MVFFVSREGVWDVTADSTSGTPALTVNSLKAGTTLKVTVNFTGQTAFNDEKEGFYYSIVPVGTNDVLALTPATAVFQGAGWHTSTLIVLFEVLATTDGETTFECHFNTGDLDGSGTMMNFVMLAEVV